MHRAAAMIGIASRAPDTMRRTFGPGLTAAGPAC
jgi:hypothetical protein